MIKLSRILLFVLFLGVIGSAWAEQDEKLSKSNQAMIHEKRQKIEDEIAQLKDHPWAGRYYFGDGLGANVSLTLAPENGFTVTWFGCMGLYDQNHGTVDWDGNVVKLSFAFDLGEGFIGYYDAEYKPIHWGERLYLIPANKIVPFCNVVNSRSEPRNDVHGFFFLRRDDEKKEAKGKPELPEEFMPYLLDEPVDAAIVSVKDIRGNGNRKIATIIVNKGKKDGLLPGMELYVVKPDRVYARVILTKVEETQSEGEFILYDVLKTPTPVGGWQLSTCPSWRR